MNPGLRCQLLQSSVAASVIFFAYGREMIDQDPLVELVETVLEQFSIGISPGAFLVEFFPICELFYHDNYLVYLFALYISSEIPP